MLKSMLTKWISEDASDDEVKQFLSGRAFPIVEGSEMTFVFYGEADHVTLRQWIYGLPSSIPMTRHGTTNIWSCVLQFPLEARIEYKFGVTRGGYEEWLHDPLNGRIAHDPFGGNSVAHGAEYDVPEWAKVKESVPKGEIHHVAIPSRVFSENRTIGVYVPAKFRLYRRYRLLVVHDGDDYVRYSLLNTILDNLIDGLEIPPLIVALTNPGERTTEYANDQRHATHLVEEVIPHLEAMFPLITTSSGRCLMGASFGGVASLSTAWHYPETFDSLLLQSGSFAFTDIGEHSRNELFDPVVEFMNRFRAKPNFPMKRCFVSCGVYESLIYENRSLVPFLQQLGIDVQYAEAFDGHNWENWRDRLRDGLTWLFPGPLWATYL